MKIKLLRSASACVSQILLVALLLLFQIGLTSQTVDEVTPFPEQPEVSIIKVISLDIFGRKDYKEEKRALKRFLKDADDARLEAFINKMEQGDPDEKLQALRHYPFMYYVLFGAWYRCHRKNPELAYRYNMIAKEYARYNSFGPEEAALVRKLTKFAKKFENGCFPKKIKDDSALIDHLDEITTQYQKENNDKAGEIDLKNDVIRKELVPLQQKSIELGKEIERLENEIKTKNVNIENLSIENWKSALSEIDNLKSKGYLNLEEPGTIVKNLSGGAILKARDEYPGEPVNPKIYNEGFKLGTFCSPEIKEAAFNIMNSIFNVIDFKSKLDGVPSNFKDSVFIDVIITGKADGNKVIRKDGNCTLQYKDNIPIMGRYFSKNDPKFKKPISVNIKKNDAICDEELAFLRANCAYYQVLNLVEKYDFPKSNIRSKLVVKISDEVGPKYRGVDIDLKIENLFLHKMETIKGLRIEKEIIDQKIAVLKKQLIENQTAIDNIKIPLAREGKIVQEKLKEIDDVKTNHRNRTIKRRQGS